MDGSLGPVAGPSRPRRPLGPTPDLADRLVAAQRKTPSSGGSSRGPQRRSEPDEYSRGPSQPRRALFDPTKSTPPPRVESPLPIEQPARAPPLPPGSPSRHPEREASDEYARGPSQPRRALFDPAKSTPPPRVESPLPVDPPARAPPLPPGSPSRHREREASDGPPRRRAVSPASAAVRGHNPSRKLFDPTVHDPHQFSRPPPPAVPTSSGSRASEPALAVRRAQLPRTAEEEADKERERRRRKEGSERGSGSSGRKKEDSGSKSKGARSLGSRSSEGSESFKDRERGKGKGDTGVKAILKDIHDRIKAIELDLTEMHRKMAADPEAGIAVLLEPVRGQPKVLSSEEDAALWLDLIVKHKQLADLHHDFLTRIFDPLVPPSLHQLTVRYNIPSRLWQNGFHLLLERLRHSWMTGHPAAVDLLTDFVYDGYKFYTDLLEDVALGGFRTAWIEALGDLARYRMAIARQLALASAGSGKGKGKSREKEVGRVDGDSPVRDEASGASIGAEVAERWDVEDTDTWRQTASDWYSMGITEKPGEGRLHHHLALLARDMPDGEGRALHHFTRSLVVTHEFPTARESILGFFDLAGQRRAERIRNGEKEGPMELFVRLHGMLFTRIELDRFDETLKELMLRLGEDGEGVGQVEWMMMASVGIAGMMQYGMADGVLRKALGQESAERRKHQTLPGGEEEGEVEPVAGGAKADEQTGVKGSDPETWPLPLTCAFRLAFAILSHTLRHPTIAQGVHVILNPYLATFLTFLATLSRQPATATIIIPWIPWSDLTTFISSTAPPLDIRPETKLVTGQPIPEDWLLRGAEWVGRRVYERGFWKVKPSSGRGSGGMAQPTQRSGERFGSEMDVLLAHFEQGVDVSQGVVDAPEGMEEVDGPAEVGKRRSRRVGWAVGVMCRYIAGLEVVAGETLEIGEPLKGMVDDIERKKAEEERERRQVKKTNGWREEEEAEEEWEVEDDDDPDLAVLRDRFKHLQSLISTPVTNPSKSHQPKPHRAPALRIVQGYTTLIFDTNVLLSSLTLIARLIESGKWTIVIPLPVLTELDGLAREPPPLGIEAVKAISYLEANVRTRSMVLRIQTTKGSYLSDLRLRTEAADVAEADKDRKTMDDKILNVARWQLDHFADRSLMLGGAGAGSGTGREASKAVLITFDRNLRLRARAAGVDAVDEREMADILGKQA